MQYKYADPNGNNDIGGTADDEGNSVWADKGAERKMNNTHTTASHRSAPVI